MNFPARHMVRYLGLLALGCQAFVIQPTSSSFLNPQQQLMFDNYQHKPPATVRSFGDSLQESVGGVSAGCSSLLPSRSSLRRASTLRHGSATSMSLASAVANRLGATTTAAAAVACRGGGVEVNVISGVLAELANIRTPAALLGGAALGTMFVQLKPGTNKRLHLIYTMLSTSAFSLQLVCVLCSTLTYTSVASRSEAMAVSAISYLFNEMQFEFFVIRSSFVYGLFSFLGALSVRGWLTFADRGSARMMMAILASSALFLLNFIHHTHNSLTLCLGGMTKAVFWLTLRNMYPTKRRFFRHALWAAMIWGAVKLLKLGPNEGADAAKKPVEGKKKAEGDASPAAKKTS